MNLWKTIHRKLIDEPIERLVGWPLYTNGALFEKTTPVTPVEGNALWKTIHRKLIDEPIERLVGWDRFAKGSWFVNHKPDGSVSGNARKSDALSEIEDDPWNQYLRGWYNEHSYYWDVEGW